MLDGFHVVGEKLGSFVSESVSPPLHAPTGPLHYSIGPPEGVSPVARAPAYTFGRTMRGMTKGSVYSAQLDADHTCGTAADTPGHIYDPYKTRKDDGIASLKFGSSVQRYSPEKGGNMGGPLVSKWVAKGTSTLNFQITSALNFYCFKLFNC